MNFSFKSARKAKVIKLIAQSKRKRKHTSVEIRSLNNEKPLYQVPVDTDILLQLLQEVPEFQFSSYRIVRFLPFLRPLLRGIVGILAKINKKLNRNRDVVIQYLLERERK